jgi:acetyl esterase/lipase
MWRREMTGQKWPLWARAVAWTSALGVFGITTLVASGFVLLARAAQPPDTVVLERDVVYRTVAGKSLKLDIVRPKAGSGPFPAILCIHGGGWQAGDKSEFLQLLYGFAQQGYVAAAVQYRLAPEFTFPAQVHDVKAAVIYLRSHAKELRIDPDRIGVMGGSAGGHLALMLATTGPADGLEVSATESASVSSRVQAVVNMAGPCDLTRPYPKASEYMVTDMVGKSRKDAPELYAKASPLKYVSAGDTPMFTIHGTKDELVPFEQSPELVAACKKVGVPAELVTIQDGGHGSGGKAEDWADAITKSVEFFNRQLKQGR